MREITFLIKPASSSCNMKCKYCFYEDISCHRDTKNFGIMKKETAKKIIENIFLNHEFENVHFAFQGGEPTLSGLDFFEYFISLVNHNKKNTIVTYSMQTNGYNLDMNWIIFFKKYKFLIGVSLDGFKENHDYYRKTNANDGTFSKVIENIQLLKENNIPYNILTVLTNRLANYPKEVYNFYKNQNFQYIQFIPCLPDLNDDRNLHSLTPEKYHSFYKTMYELWIEDIELGNYFSIGLFDNIASLLMRSFPQQCGFVGRCNIQYVIESDGSVYPCDFYVLDQYKLGNIKEDSIESIQNHCVGKKFLADNVIPNICDTCRYKKICNGQCKRQRTTFIKKDYCGYQKLLDDILDDFYEHISMICEVARKL